MCSDEDSDSDGDEDEDTAELLRELEKIKRERAEEKARLEREQSASTAAVREAEIATANPLLNLAAVLGQQAPRGVSTTVPGTFAVKKRWDDGASSHDWYKLTTNSSTNTRPHIQESSHDIARQVWSIRERFVADRIPQVRSFFCIFYIPFSSPPRQKIHGEIHQGNSHSQTMLYETTSKCHILSNRPRNTRLGVSVASTTPPDSSAEPMHGHDRSQTHPLAAHSGISVSKHPRLVVYLNACRKM